MILIRRYILFVVLALTLGLTACNKWLDIKPTSQVDEAELFSSPQGFEDIMTGVYTQAATRSLYGARLSSTLIEVLAQRYTNIKTNTFHQYYEAALYNYANGTIKAQIDSLWYGMYAAIAQTNFLLKNTDGAKARGVFTSDQQYRLYKGQALGTRAFLHFDLLRLFAQSYVADATTRYIPYMTAFTVTPQASISTSAVLDSCISDLKKADTLLWDAGKGTGFWFNRWAAKATLARIYLYKGDKVNALAYAKQVISGAQYRFITSAEASSATPDRVFTPESIFSLSVYGLQTISDTYFSEKANVATLPERVYLQVSDATLKANYDYSVSGYGSDPRYKLWWQLQTGATTVFFSKYWTTYNTVNRVPLIGLPEMYYIAAESETDVAAGKAYIDTVHIKGRFIPAVTANSASELQTQIAKEYVKEFYGAGQLFFYYKRRDEAVPGASVTGKSLFLLPIPVAEQEFRF